MALRIPGLKSAASQTSYRLTWLDYGLSAFASTLALYSVGMGLNTQSVGYYFIFLALGGTLFSYIVHSLLPPKALSIDGYLYVVAAVAAIYLARPLNDMLPDNGFDPKLMVAGVISWMIVFGSFVQWRDATILFQAVPTIAVFGLVGAWDTFPAAPFAFFGFLLCFATMFARAHARTMIFFAQSSGYKPELADQKGARFWDSLRAGPWKWMAGPEWALGSAAAVVLLSVLGAPVIQSASAGISGFVKINVPQPKIQATASSDPFRSSTSTSVSVGNGPKANLSKTPVFKISGPGVTYYRMRTYDSYTGHGWNPVTEFTSLEARQSAIQDPNSLWSESRKFKGPERECTINFLPQAGGFDSLPLPGEFHDIGASDSGLLYRPDGTVRLNPGSLQNQSFKISYYEPVANPVLNHTAEVEGPYTNTGSRPLSPRLQKFVADATATAHSDYEKAVALKHAIESTVAYSLDCPAVPSGSDPVDYFLFESKLGYCDLFATAMTITARAAHLPARYVTGYYPSLDERDANGFEILHESEAHAWCEIYFEGAGWVQFDATEGAPERGRPVVGDSLFDRPWVRTIAFTLGGLALLFVPFGVSYFLKNRRRGADPNRSELARMYGRFVGILERRTGKPRRPSQTPAEYLATIMPDLDGSTEAVSSLNEQFVTAFYSKPTVTPEEVTKMRESLKQAEGVMKNIKRHVAAPEHNGAADEVGSGKGA